MKRWQADLLLLLVACIWGLSFVFQKTAMESIGPMTFIAARSLVGAIALIPFVMWEARSQSSELSPEFWRWTAMTSVVLFIGEAVQQIGIVTSTATNAGFLTTLYIVCVPFVAWALMGERPPLIVWMAALLSVAGTALLSGAYATASMSFGDRLIAASAVVWATHVVMTSMSAKFARPILFTFGQFALVTVYATIGTLMSETVSLDALVRAAPEIAFVGILSTAVTFTLFAIALRYAPPGEATIIISTENVFSALGGAFLLGERLGWMNWMGAALIVIATLWVRLGAKEPKAEDSAAAH